MRTSDAPAPAASSQHAAPVQLSIVSDFGALAPHAAAWNALVPRACTGTVFQTFEFHASWWSVFGADKQAHVLMAYAGGELVGIAPLMVSRRRMLGRMRRMVQFIGARSFDYTDFIVDRRRPDVLELFVSALCELEPRFHVLYLRDIPDTSPTLRVLPAILEARGLRPDTRLLYDAPTRLFNDPTADRQLPNKKSLRRHHNYFQRAGTLEIVNLTRAEEIEKYLEAFFAQHVRRRAATADPSPFVDERMRAFFRELVRTLAPRGWLLFTAVVFDAKPVAMHLGFEYGGRIIWYKPAFDVDYARHSPGEVLLKHLFEYALERGVAELDFTIGAEPFKYRFANHVRHNYAVRVVRGALLHTSTRLLMDVKGRLERWPTLARWARKAFGRRRDHAWS